MKAETYGEYCATIEKAVRHVHSNLDRWVSVVELADLCFLSPFHFQRVFKRIAGESVGHLSRRLRLEWAAWRLQNTDDSIGEIAHDVGYESMEPFARAFRTEFASSPTQFRRSQWLTYRHAAANEAHYSPDGCMRFTPLDRENCDAPFEVRETPRFEVACAQHHGSPMLIGKSVRAFWEEGRVFGLDPFQDPLISFAKRLRARTPARDVESFVGTRSDLVPVGVFGRAAIGGGRHFVVSHRGDSDAVADFWFRMWAEILPASGLIQREGPVFQVARTRSGFDFETEIYVPVEA